MKVRNAQSDPRKNPDSPRVHGLRLSLNSSTERIENRENANDRVEPRSSSTVTDYKREGVQERKREGGFEPLLDVAEAAKLLRIHPKTLRAKARRGDHSRNTDWSSLEISGLGAEPLVGRDRKLKNHCKVRMKCIDRSHNSDILHWAVSAV